MSEVISKEQLRVIVEYVKDVEGEINAEKIRELDKENAHSDRQWKQLVELHHEIHISKSLKVLKKKYKWNPQGYECAECNP